MLKEYGLNYEKRRTNDQSHPQGGKQRRLAAEVRRTHRNITYPDRQQPVFFCLLTGQSEQ